jgi:hypothetical protein
MRMMIIREKVRGCSTMKGTIQGANELEFSVFCIENIALRLGTEPEKVYKALTEKSDILNDYIVPEYEMLHTQSKDYIVDDILELMAERGVEV